MGVSVTPPAAVNLADNPKNRLYRATVAGTYSVNIPVGVYEVTRQATTNIIIGSTTLVPSTTMQVLFVNETQNQITFNSTVSSDIVPWSTPTSRTTNGDVQRLHFLEGNFIATPTSRPFYEVSTDGVSWTRFNYNTPTSDSEYYNMIKGPQFYVLAQQGTPQIGFRLRFSTNLVNWAWNDSNQTDVRSVAFGNGLYVASGRANNTTVDVGRIIWSTTPAIWTGAGTGIVDPIVHESFFASVFGNGIFVSGSTRGSIFTSTTGTTWTYRNSTFGGNIIRDIQYGNGNFVAVGAQGSVSVSTDGTTWVAKQPPGGALNYYNARFNPDDLTWAITDNGNQIRVSTDLNTWTVRSFPENIREYAIAYGNGRYVYSSFVDGTNTRYRNVQNLTTLVPSAPFDDTYIILEYKGKTKVLS